MNRRGASRSVSLFAEERGGAHIFVLALLVTAALLTVTVVGFNVTLQDAAKNALKARLDTATHAAALDYDRVEASYGRLAWDVGKGTAAFYRYLYLNLRLDATGGPLPGSMLAAKPVVHKLEFVTAATYPYNYAVTVTLHHGTPQETVRKVETRLYGPSVVAVVEIAQRQIGGAADEPVVVSSVSSVRLRP